MCQYNSLDDQRDLQKVVYIYILNRYFALPNSVCPARNRVPVPIS